MLRFTLGRDNRTVSDWRTHNVSPWTNARRHALEFGAAGVFRANGSFRLFYRDGDKLRQKTFAKACPA